MSLLTFKVSDFVNRGEEVKKSGRHFTAFLWALLLLVSQFQLKAQEFPATFRGTFKAMPDSALNTDRLIRLESHIFSIAQKDADSLENWFLPNYQDYIDSLDPKLQAEALESMLIICYQQIGNLDMAEAFLEKRIQILEEIGQEEMLAVALSQLMFLQADQEEKEKAIETSIRLREMIRLNGAMLPDRKSFLYRQLCGFYHKVRETQLGIEICNIGVEYAEEAEDDRNLAGIYESLALLHENRGSAVDSIIDYRKMAIRKAEAAGDSFILRTLYRNMARTYAKLDRRVEARDYYEKTFKIYENYPYLFGMITDLTSYGNFLLDVQDVSGAEDLYQNLRSLYPGYAHHEESVKHLANFGMKIMVTRADVDSFNYYKAVYDSLWIDALEKDKLGVREELLVEYETKEKEAQNKILEARNRGTMIALIAVGLVAILLIFLVNTIVKRRKAERVLHEQKEALMASDLERTALEKEQSEQRNNQLKAELQERVKQITEHQMLNAELKQLLNDLNNNLEQPENRKLTRQMKNLVGRKATEAALEEIAQKINDFYPGLQDQLEDKLGEKKEAEVYTTMLYLMDYRTEDIAKLLQKTEKAVRNIRYRVRKKLDMAEELDFQDGVKEILHLVS
ncbi:tetratricopeptide repeat protein [Croceimicrobium sp.]|uniref:tetratricopeptide repeat protein n=1 Tax=Croceimicrobium sp. TaxID=2828340 RepID=UPI003BABAEF8